MDVQSMTSRNAPNNKDLFLNGIYEITNLSGFSGCLGPGECRTLNVQRVYSTMDHNDTEVLAMGWCFLEESSQNDSAQQNASPVTPGKHALTGFRCGSVHRHEWTCRFNILPQSMPYTCHQDKDTIIISRGDEEVLEKFAGKRGVCVTYAPEHAPHERHPLHEMYVHPQSQRLIAPSELTETPVFYACASCNTKVKPRDEHEMSYLHDTSYQEQCERCFECPLCGAYLIASEANEWRYFYCGYCKWTSVHLEHGKVPNTVKFSQLFDQVTAQEHENTRALEQQRSVLALKEMLRTMQKEVLQSKKTPKELKAEMPDFITLQTQQLRSGFPTDISQFVRAFEGKKKLADETVAPSNTTSLDQLFSKESAQLRQRSSNKFDFKSLLPLHRRREQPSYASDNIFDLYPFRRKLYPRFEKRFENNVVLLPEAGKIDFEINKNATLFLPVTQVTHIPVFMYRRETYFCARFVNPTEYDMTLRFASAEEELKEYNTAKVVTTESTLRLSSEMRYLSSPSGGATGDDAAASEEEESARDPFIMSQSPEGDWIELRFDVTPQRCDEAVRVALQMWCGFTAPQYDFQVRCFVCFDFGFPML